MYKIFIVEDDNTISSIIEEKLNKWSYQTLRALKFNDMDMNAGEISSCFNMSQPSISKHLDILREVELVSSEKQGQFVIYSINISVLQEALGRFLDLFPKNKK